MSLVSLTTAYTSKPVHLIHLLLCIDIAPVWNKLHKVSAYVNVLLFSWVRLSFCFSGGGGECRYRITDMDSFACIRLIFKGPWNEGCFSSAIDATNKQTNKCVRACVCVHIMKWNNSLKKSECKGRADQP